jgi:glyoxylase-like metal-dependent hydrolase (beta-lactamase superfamily II)
MATAARIRIIVYGSLALVGLLASIGSLQYLNASPPIPDLSLYAPPDLAELRRLATQHPDPADAPIRLNRLRVALAAPDRSFNAFQLVYRPRGVHTSIVIDPVHDRRRHDEIPGAGRYDPLAYERLQAELQRVRVVLITQEVFYHLGGLSRSDQLYAIRDRIRLTEAQIRSPRLIESRFPPAVLEAMRALPCSSACSPAAGVVLVPTPSHTPGAQLIYIRLASGREYVLVGEQSITRERIEGLQALRRLDYLLAREDSACMAHLLRMLHDLKKKHPGLHIIPVHDEPGLQAEIETGSIGDGFEYDSPFRMSSLSY